VGVLHLPGRLEVLAQTPILILACVLFLVEFLADKIPAVDSVWDAIHTFIRIPAAGVLGFAALSDVAEPWRMAAALLCGTIALSTHGLKAGTRLALNTSPEPFTNWTASLSEDAVLVVLIWMVVRHPLLALFAGLLALALGFLTLRWLSRSLKRIFAPEPRPASRATL
jgi:hypothetical protein